MADCSKLAFNIDINDFGYNPSLYFPAKYPDFTQDILNHFRPYPSLPGNVELPPIPEPASAGTPTDVISNLLDKMPPLMGALAPIFSAMNMLKCIIDVLCAIPNPYSMLRQVRSLLTDCLPAFIQYIPEFYMIHMIITIIRLVIALMLLILECIIDTIEAMKAVYDELKAILTEDDPTQAYAAVVKLVCQMGNRTKTCFGPISVLDPIFDFIAPFLGLAESSFAWSFSKCVRAGSDGDTCPPDDEMERYLENPNDPAGFSFDPATIPLSCYPDIDNLNRMYEQRYGKEILPMPNAPDIDGLFDDLDGYADLLIADEGEDPIDYANRIGDFFDEYGDEGAPFSDRLNKYVDDLKCVLYAAACNAIDSFATTFTVDVNTVVADDESYATLTIVPRNVGGDPIGPVGYDRIPSPFEPSISTDIGEVYDLAEQEDGSFMAKIKSDTAGVATVCAYIKCVLCTDEEIDSIDSAVQDPQPTTSSYTITTKTIDGRTMVRRVMTIEEFTQNEEFTTMDSIEEIPPADGYGASEFEIVTSGRCLSITFTEPGAPAIVGNIGKCE
jgi:hypothetical protein